MGKLAFIFPGQGSQAVGMGVGLAEQFPEARALFDDASKILGWDLFQICKKGPEEKLKQTNITQPALYVTGVAAAAVLQKKGLKPEAAAGHSIGEYAALAVAGVFSFSDGLKLVQERGRLMQGAGQKRPGSMAAILGLAPERVEAVCKQVSPAGICVAVNFNSPEQVVIAGEKAAVEETGKLATAAGAKRVIVLNVSGAFHSPLMAEAAAVMKEELSRIAFKEPSIPVAMNADGMLHAKAADIREQLTLQLDHPVQWVKSIRSLAAAGCTHFVECGSGRVLSGLVKKIDRSFQALSTESVEAVQQTAGALSASGKESL